MNSKKETVKQLIIFLIICLPVSWIIFGLSFLINGDSEIQIPGAYALYQLACYMPAIAAVIASIITKQRLRELRFLPKLKENGRLYIGTILVALVICILDVPLAIVLFFPSVGRFNSELGAAAMVFQLLLYTAIGTLQFFVVMGEEIGWMGFLFPRLEKLFGTNIAIVATGIIRGCWHIVILAGNGEFLKNFLILIATNILGGCILALLTKKSGSVVPAAILHALNNSLPAVIFSFITVDATLYESHETAIEFISYIPYVIIMFVCWIILMKRYRVRLKTGKKIYE